LHTTTPFGHDVSGPHPVHSAKVHGVAALHVSMHEDPPLQRTLPQPMGLEQSIEHVAPPEHITAQLRAPSQSIAGHCAFPLQAITHAWSPQTIGPQVVSLPEHVWVHDAGAGSSAPHEHCAPLPHSKEPLSGTVSPPDEEEEDEPLTGARPLSRAVLPASAVASLPEPESSGEGWSATFPSGSDALDEPKPPSSLSNTTSGIASQSTSKAQISSAVSRLIGSTRVQRAVHGGACAPGVAKQDLRVICGRQENPPEAFTDSPVTQAGPSGRGGCEE
jgi:hypothetical protein